MSNVTGLKEGRIRLEEFALGLDDATYELVESAGLSADQFVKWGDEIAKGGDVGAKAFENVANAIMSVEDEAIKNSLAAAFMGTMYEDSGDAIFEALLSSKEEAINLGEATENLAEKTGKIDESPTVKLKNAFNDMMEALAPLLTKVAELITKFAEWASENPKLTATFAAVGSAVGIVSGAFLALLPVITTIAQKVLPRLLPLLAGINPVAAAVAAGLAAIGIAGYKFGKEMSKSSIEVEGWADDVSEGTAKAVGGFIGMSDKVSMELDKIAWSGAKVSQDMADSITNSFDKMGDDVLKAMEEDHTKQLDSMSKFFQNSAALTEEEEKKIIEKMVASNELEAQTVEAGKAKVAEIMERAKNNNRGLTEQERDEIALIQQQMTNNAIQYMSESERDQKVILERLKTESSEITAQQAAEVVKNSLAQKDETIKNANDQYNQTVAEIIKQRDETGAISAEQAEKLMADAKKQRDDVVKNAEEMHTNVVTEAKNQATEHVNEVDWETGEILTKWQTFEKDFIKTWKNISVETGKELAGLITDITKKMETAEGKVNTALDKIEGFFESVELKLPEIQLPKMPRIELKTSTKKIFDKTLTYPSGFDVIWNAAGGILDTATLIGAGEAGKEAIIPLSEQALKPFAKAIVASMPRYSSMAANDEITNNFNIDQLVIREEADIQKLAQQIAKEQTRLQRAGGRVYFD